MCGRSRSGARGGGRERGNVGNVGSLPPAFAAVALGLRGGALARGLLGGGDLEGRLGGGGPAPVDGIVVIETFVWRGEREREGGGRRREREGEDAASGQRPGAAVGAGSHRRSIVIICPGEHGVGPAGNKDTSNAAINTNTAPELLRSHIL